MLHASTALDGLELASYPGYKATLDSWQLITFVIHVLYSSLVFMQYYSL